ncbi:MAG TPA: hypothetical protein ACFYD7_01775 [Candidatus Wujingus californicus]|nr:hypothetical protein [Planctomycetota bacterium]
MFAIPAGIVSSGFAEKLRKTHEKLKTCPPLWTEYRGITRKESKYLIS